MAKKKFLAGGEQQENGNHEENEPQGQTIFD
jgi:hypothetical protein